MAGGNFTASEEQREAKSQSLLMDIKNIKKHTSQKIPMNLLQSSKIRPFTLLEIVIVIVLIGIMAVFGTWSLTDLLAQHRRQAEVDELQNFIQELQIEALALQSDLEITFTKDKDKLEVRSKTAEKILHKRTVVLKGVRAFKFRDLVKPSHTLQIFSTGRIEPQGLFEIEREKGSVFIDVRQPLLVKFSDQRPVVMNEAIPDKPKKNEVVCNS
jgi:type II secretory pathway pseudopilin PulG